jgi:hypothetical protein
MRKILFLTFIFVVINVFSLPKYVFDGKKEKKVKFITYLYPFVFYMDSSEIKVKESEKEFLDIQKKGTLKRKIFTFNSSKIYIDLFVCGFSRASLQMLETVEGKSNKYFAENTLVEAKKKNLKMYIETFKKAYVDTDKYFKSFKKIKPEKLVNEIYFVPFFVKGSPEETSFSTGKYNGDDYFTSYFDKVLRYSPDSESMKKFIKSYAYYLGEVAYIKTYYVEG